MVALDFNYLLILSGVSPSMTSTPERRGQGRESPSPSTTARSSRRDSLTDKSTGVATKITENSSNSQTPVRQNSTKANDHGYNGDLFKEYQKQKQKLQDTIQQKEKERDELVRQLSAPLPPQIPVNNRIKTEM